MGKHTAQTAGLAMFTKKAFIHTHLNLSGQPREPDQHVSKLLN